MLGYRTKATGSGTDPLHIAFSAQYKVNPTLLWHTWSVLVGLGVALPAGDPRRCRKRCAAAASGGRPATNCDAHRLLGIVGHQRKRRQDVLAEDLGVGGRQRLDRAHLCVRTLRHCAL